MFPKSPNGDYWHRQDVDVAHQQLEDLIAREMPDKSSSQRTAEFKKRWVEFCKTPQDSTKAHFPLPNAKHPAHPATHPTVHPVPHPQPETTTHPSPPHPQPPVKP